MTEAAMGQLQTIASRTVAILWIITIGSASVVVCLSLVTLRASPQVSNDSQIGIEKKWKVLRDTKAAIVRTLEAIQKDQDAVHKKLQRASGNLRLEVMVLRTGEVGTATSPQPGDASSNAAQNPLKVPAVNGGAIIPTPVNEGVGRADK